ncbi:hypothetical protein GCM10025331_64760 [Actinoplanes utahensis]|nr:hypothetical protein Aut01nite_42300 [Actinoplanes utahensis]
MPALETGFVPAPDAGFLPEPAAAAADTADVFAVDRLSWRVFAPEAPEAPVEPEAPEAPEAAEAPEATPAALADAAGVAAARLPVPEAVVLGLRPAPEAAGLVGAFLAAGIEVFLLAE